MLNVTSYATKALCGAAIVILSLSGGARADVAVSGSNDPSEQIDQHLVSLMSGERDGLGKLSAKRIAKITTTPEGATPPKITAEWLAQQPAAKGGQQFECLADVLYHEARGESVQGQVAVAEVVLNRVEDPAFPNTVCGVVHQSNRRGCQFSWTCDGKSDRIGESSAYSRVKKVARAMMDGAPRVVTDGATFFHTPAVKPSWARRFVRTAKVGAHIFYRKPVRTASN
ncbi:hypothetical protein BFP70_16490 [Thioclava sp. SK-1]|nr:cell wall hydrolase [Thioclava sp. SK-1]OCX61205.1 hypothetical protein BFP70_16490 [Thioclava sp. SK-1]